jgi:predicted nucleic acid-binding protein
LERIASRSGGANITPQLVVTDCEDWEDNRILELAAESGAVLIVSNDDHLLGMSPWRGTAVVDPRAFVAKVERCDASGAAPGRAKIPELTKQ